MPNEIVATFKAGGGYDAPWLVIHADSPQILDQAVDLIDLNLITKLHGLSDAFKVGGALVQVAPPVVAAAPPVTSQTVNNPPPQTPWGGSTAVSDPVQPVAQPQGGALPNGVKFWTAPDHKKPEYNAFWFTLPFIQDKVARDSFNGGLKSKYWAKWNGETGDDSAWYANAKHAAAIEADFRANASLFG